MRAAVRAEQSASALPRYSANPMWHLTRRCKINADEMLDARAKTRKMDHEKNVADFSFDVEKYKTVAPGNR